MDGAKIMYKLDPMLNEKGRRKRHQDIFRWTQHERLVCEIEAAQSKDREALS